MKNLRDSFRIYMEGDGAGGASGSAPPAPPAPPPPVTQPTATPPPSSSSTPPAPGTPPPATPPTTPAPAAAPAPNEGTILASAKADAPPATPPAAPDESAVNTFVDSVKVDLGEFGGKKVELNKDAVRSIAPVALKHKLSPEAIGEIIAAYDGYERKQIESFIAQEKAEAAAARQKVQQEFGNDLPTFVQDAAKGAKFLFGDELMGRLFNDPRYGNDAAFIKAMAQFGRMVKTDGGIGGDPQGSEEDLATRWLKSSAPRKE